MSVLEFPKPSVSVALAFCLTALSGTAGLAQTGKLGTAGVAVQTSKQSGGGTQVVVQRNGRDFAKYSAPAGATGGFLCCTFGKCEPLGRQTDICDIVIWCPADWAGCSPR